MAFNSGGDLCLGFWKEIWDAGTVQFPQGATVLEIGCAEADWLTPMKAERRDLELIGLDWRTCERPGGTVVKGNVMDASLWPGETFDAIVSVSAIEHVGLGSYDNDPQDRYGDTKAMQHACDWLKPGGWMYLDIPYRPHGPYEVNSNFRAYDEENLQKRLIVPGFREEYRQIMGEARGDGPYLALVLRKV